MMLITNQEMLRAYRKAYRFWQGVPGIAVTKKGRIFSVFYSGGIEEDLGKNFVALLMSEDGIHFSEPIAVAYQKDARCFDGCVWIDPLGRLWLLWAVYPDLSNDGNYGTYAAICENPDADVLVWGKEFLVGRDVMLNKPTVLSTGEWLFPISVWGENVWTTRMPERRTTQKEMGAFVYVTCDQGKTFQRLGGMLHPDHCYDEHMVVEKADGTLQMYTRTMQGIGVSCSYDQGKTWTDGIDSGLIGPNSRFHIRKLKSGRWLLVNHDNGQERDRLTAYLSEDEGKTWPYRLLLDEREQVSYPDGMEAEDGFLYITYDRERGGGQRRMEDIFRHAREILYAKITEEDILSGTLSNPNSVLKQVVSRLGEYQGQEQPMVRPVREREIAEYLLQFDDTCVAEKLFDRYQGMNRKIAGKVAEEIDALFESLKYTQDRKEVLAQILTKIAYETPMEAYPVVEAVRDEILKTLDTDVDAFALADRLGVSRYWLKYRFEKATKISVEEYQKTLRKVAATKK